MLTVLQFEVLRLYTPVAHLMREVAPGPMQVVTSSDGKQHTMSAGMRVGVSGAMAHVSPDQWGEDALIFRPTRWLTDDDETLDDPVQRGLLAWSTGPRSCPGMKMSQVEFVSVFMTIFRRYRVQAVLRAGESKAQAQRRLQRVIDDSQPLITLQMNRPKEVEVKWSRR